MRLFFLILLAQPLPTVASSMSSAIDVESSGSTTVSSYRALTSDAMNDEIVSGLYATIKLQIPNSDLPGEIIDVDVGFTDDTTAESIVDSMIAYCRSTYAFKIPPSIQGVLLREADEKLRIRRSMKNALNPPAEDAAILFEVTYPCCSGELYTLTYYDGDNVNTVYHRYQGKKYIQHAHRTTIIHTLHQGLIRHIKKACKSSSLNSLSCYEETAIANRPSFPGYELQTPLEGSSLHTFLTSYAQRINAELCIETGSFLGDTTASLSLVCKRVVTVEVVRDLYENVKSRFDDQQHVTALHASSAEILNINSPHRPLLATSTTGSALWFLDGHYSGGLTGSTDDDDGAGGKNPIYKELEFILETRFGVGGEEDQADKSFDLHGDVIIIDDARTYKGSRLTSPDNDDGEIIDTYPELDSIVQFVLQRCWDCSVDLEFDEIVIKRW